MGLRSGCRQGVISMLAYALLSGAAHADILPWLIQKKEDPFNTQKKVAKLIAPDLKPDTCPTLPDLKRKLNFSEVVVAVLCNNPDTKASYLNLAGQGASYGTNYAGYLPNADAVIGLSRASNFASHSKDTNISRTSGVALSMVLYDFGQRELKLEAGEYALIAAGHSYNSGLQGAIALAMQGYYTLLTAQNALKVATETERYARESFDAAQLRHKIGQVPLADVLQARGVYSSQLLNTMQAKNQLKLSQASMALLMGQPADMPVTVQEVDNKTLNNEPFGDEVRALMDRAKAQRQDLQASRAQVQQSQTALRALKRSNLGTITATTGLGVDNAQNTNIFTSTGTRSQSMGISVSIPIFTGFNQTYTERAAEKALEAQKESLKGTELKVEQDVWNAWHNYETAKQSWETSQDQLRSATQLRDVALGRYKEGLGTILDVLNAQSQYSSALQNNLQSRYNILTSRVDLVRAVGSLNMDNAYPQTNASDVPINETEKAGSRETN